MKLHCLIPFVGYHITSGNLGRVCNIGNHPIAYIDKNTNLQNLWYDNIKKQQYYNNAIPIACKECYHQEMNGLKTRRIRFKKFNNHFTIDENNITLQYLNINFSNICNLDCVMCSSEFSSSWIPNDKKIINEFPFRNHTDQYLKIDRIPLSFIDQIQIKELKFVEIKGGEPLIDSGVLYFFDKFIKEKGTASIHLTTNLNSLTDEFKERLVLLPRVSFDVSVDCIDDLYHYIRGNNSSIKKVEENLLFIKNLKTLFELRINITTMPYNLWDSYKVINWIKNIDKKIIINWCNIISVPSYLEPSLIPYEQRLKSINLIETYIKKYNIEKHHLIDLKMILNYLSKENPRNDSIELINYKRKSFIEWTNYINKIRNMNVYKIVHQLNNLGDIE